MGAPPNPQEAPGLAITCSTDKFCQRSDGLLSAYMHQRSSSPTNELKVDLAYFIVGSLTTRNHAEGRHGVENQFTISYIKRVRSSCLRNVGAPQYLHLTTRNHAEGRHGVESQFTISYIKRVRSSCLRNVGAPQYLHSNSSLPPRICTTSCIKYYWNARNP